MPGLDIVTLDVESSHTIEDAMALLTVQIPQIDFDQVRFTLNGRALPRNQRFKECNIRDDMTVQVDLAPKKSWCCIF